MLDDNGIWSDPEDYEEGIASTSTKLPTASLTRDDTEGRQVPLSIKLLDESDAEGEHKTSKKCKGCKDANKSARKNRKCAVKMGKNKKSER